MADPVPVGKIPSGLFLVTVAVSGRREGFLGSWIQQASFEPMMISVALQPDRPAWGLLRETGRFCVNIIGHENHGVMKPFWGKYVPGADPFTDIPHELTARGNLLLPDAMAALECELRGFHQPGDHVIAFGEVVETHLIKPGDKPMVHVRKSGAAY